jgi:hypothetical protein
MSEGENRMNSRGLRLLACLLIVVICTGEAILISADPLPRPLNGQQCGGVNLVMNDRIVFHSVRTGLTLISVLYRF